MTIKIEKNIPVPTMRKSGLTASMAAMEVGDSFLIDKLSRTLIYPTGRRLLPKKFSVRTVSDTELRVWRTA